MIKITAPSKVDGVQMYGPHAIQFTRGVAEVSDLPWAVESYMRDAGYQVEKSSMVGEEGPEPDLTVGVEPDATPPVDVAPEPNPEPVMVGETSPELVELPKPGRVTRARKPKAE